VACERVKPNNITEEMLGFCNGAVQISLLLGCSAAYMDVWSSKFRENIMVSSESIKILEQSHSGATPQYKKKIVPPIDRIFN